MQLSLESRAAASRGSSIGGGGPSYDPDSPEGKAYLYRDSVMELADAKASLLVGMTRQEVALDEVLRAAVCRMRPSAAA